MYPFFHSLFTQLVVSYQSTGSFFFCALLIETGQILYETHGLHVRITFKDARIPYKK